MQRAFINFNIMSNELKICFQICFYHLPQCAILIWDEVMRTVRVIIRVPIAHSHIWDEVPHSHMWEWGNINVVGNWRMSVLGDLNERAISLKEVGGAVK